MAQHDKEHQEMETEFCTSGWVAIEPNSTIVQRLTILHFVGFVVPWLNLKGKKLI